MNSGPVHSVANIFRPASTPAESIAGLSMLVMAVCLAIFAVVAGVLVYTIVRRRWPPAPGNGRRRLVAGRDAGRAPGTARVQTEDSWSALHAQRRVVEHLEAGTGGHRVRVPYEIHPYSAGVKGAAAGAVAMALVAHKTAQGRIDKAWWNTLRGSHRALICWSRG